MASAATVLAPGLVLFQSRLPPAEQRHLWSLCRSLAEGPVPMYTPTVRGGRKMSVGMLCLGKHWNATTYRYEDTRSDFDGLPAPPIPPEFDSTAASAAADAGFAMKPDLCIMNFYTDAAKMGVHQDKDERPETIAAGIPIVSVSLGDAARFVIATSSVRRFGPMKSPRPVLPKVPAGWSTNAFGSNQLSTRPRTALSGLYPGA